ncbi:MAG: hypothetical protein ACOX5W_12055 [Bacillota bacterium]
MYTGYRYYRLLWRTVILIGVCFWRRILLLGHERNRRIKTLMCGFGIGLSWGVVSAEVNTDDIYPITESDEYYTEGAVSHD